MLFPSLKLRCFRSGLKIIAILGMQERTLNASPTTFNRSCGEGHYVKSRLAASQKVQKTGLFTSRPQ